MKTITVQMVLYALIIHADVRQDTAKMLGFVKVSSFLVGRGEVCCRGNHGCIVDKRFLCRG